MQIFGQSLADKEVLVRVAGLNAVIAFLTSLNDQEMVLQYQEIMPQLLNTVVDALKADEEQGKLAMQSMVELTNVHPEIWKQTSGQLIFVASEIMMNTDFEVQTRTSANEVILTLADHMPAALRKADQTKEKFLPALLKMLCEIEEDEETWASTNEESEISKNDVHSIARSAFVRISTQLGEKTMMSTMSPLIKACISSDKWQEKQAGFLVVGLISEACKGAMKKNLTECVKMVCMGIVDSNSRVRYSSLTGLAMLLTELGSQV
jgi:hypothetical protein